MRFIYRFLAGCACVAAMAGTAQAQSRPPSGQGATIPQVAFENRLLMLELEGDFGMSAAGGPLPVHDMAGDIDLDDEIWAWGMRASIGNVRTGWLEFGLMRFASKGERFAHRDLLIRGVNFPTGTRMESRLDFRWSELVLGQLYGRGSAFYIGYEVGGADYRYRLRVRAPLDQKHVRVDEEPSLPLVGVKLGMALGKSMLLIGTLRGNFFSFGDLDSNVLEASIDLRMHMGNWLLIHFGWRYFRLDAEFDLGGADVAVTDFYVQGPYLSIEIRIG